MTQQQVRLLILSDTHDNSFPLPLPAVDVVIHCGDLTMIGGLSNYRRALDCLAACSAEVKLVIAGNHDNEPSRAHALFTSDTYTSRGVRFLQEGTHEIALHDGRRFKVYASPYTPAFGGYAFGYTPEEDRFNSKGSLGRIPESVDIVVTHGPPQPPGSAAQISDASKSYRLDLSKGEHLGCPRLWEAIVRVKPKLHCFGHIHEGHGAQMAKFDGGVVTFTDTEVVHRGGALFINSIASIASSAEKTLMVNASIMRYEEEKLNSPWVVDMIL
ncbi:Ser/Thr protein phosphatase family protein [Thozetella sp. PMI_491]|nr:Ser/Thr protein phosphatase family protein [Thozetella sp. PMI_491]